MRFPTKLSWRCVDFERRQILVGETFTHGAQDGTKTDGSVREVEMNRLVLEALKRPRDLSAHLGEYVFCGRAGQPIESANFVNRVWYPLLRHLSLAKRRPYQMCHTAATLWLAAGESPEWIARQLGHTTTKFCSESIRATSPTSRGATAPPSSGCWKASCSSCGLRNPCCDGCKETGQRRRTLRSEHHFECVQEQQRQGCW